MSEVVADAIVISCVVEAKPLTALRRLRAAGISSVMDYFTLTRLAAGELEPVVHLENAEVEIRNHLEYYRWLDGRMADEVSRQTLRKVVSFRGTRDVSHLEGFACATDRQYFEDFLRLDAGEVFVDGGGFDGETTVMFRQRCPEHGSIHVFEPSPVPMETARRRLPDDPRIHFISKGLYDRPARLRFDPNAGSASRLSAVGESEIEVTTLDEAVREPVGFVKLDVEGAECRALQGARRHILHDHPKLAVCVYHQQSDFWRVPAIILNVRDDYDVHLRHYTEGVLETVMFFIPAAGDRRHSAPPPLPAS